MAGKRDRRGSSGQGQIRAFLAFEIPDSCRQAIAEHQSRLRATMPPARWVRPEGVHLTLKFLGDTDPEVLESLTAELTPAVAGLPAVTVALGGSGVFPNRSRARVAWLGGSADGVEPVVAAIEKVAGDHGFDRERRRWSLHLTLARLRQPWPQEVVESFIQWGEGLCFDPFRCAEVVLFSSLLKPTGAVYTALERISLAGDAAAGGGR
jgi:2'-5' RNA ligase